jgi:hypothetical protein
MAANKHPFRELLLRGRANTEREHKVLEYICHRLGDGAHFRAVIQEEYVRRNASPAWVQYALDDPRLVATAHQKMRDAFSSGRLDPKSSPGIV